MVRILLPVKITINRLWVQLDMIKMIIDTLGNYFSTIIRWWMIQNRNYRMMNSERLTIKKFKDSGRIDI